MAALRDQGRVQSGCPRGRAGRGGAGAIRGAAAGPTWPLACPRPADHELVGESGGRVPVRGGGALICATRAYLLGTPSNCGLRTMSCVGSKGMKACCTEPSRAACPHCPRPAGHPNPNPPNDERRDVWAARAGPRSRRWGSNEGQKERLTRSVRPPRSTCACHKARYT